MYDPTIYKKIQLLSYVIDDIKDLEVDMRSTQDPALLLEYKQEMKELVEELTEVSNRVISLVEVYLEACKETNEPVCLDFYRVYRELQKALP